MTKQHFIALADMIRYQNSTLSHIVNGGRDSFSENQIKVIADFCQSQNPNFNRERWLDYIAGKCGSNGGKVSKVKSNNPITEGR